MRYLSSGCNVWMKGLRRCQIRRSVKDSSVRVFLYIVKGVALKYVALAWVTTLVLMLRSTFYLALFKSFRSSSSPSQAG
jgi:hypothetical protein